MKLPSPFAISFCLLRYATSRPTLTSQPSENINGRHDTQDRIFGQIETTAAFKDLVKVIANLDEYEGDENSARQALVDANLEGEGFEIEESCYNYRSDTVNEIIKVAKKHKIDLVTTLTEGGMSNPGTIRFVRDGHASFELPTMDGKVSVNSDVIAKLKSRGMTTLDELDTSSTTSRLKISPNSRSRTK
jgi:hypothetical protein